MKIQLDINDIKSIDISHGTLEELIALQNKISEKIFEVKAEQPVNHHIYQEYSTSDYNKFLDVCIGLSFSWYIESEWYTEFLLRLKSFIIHTQGIYIDVNKLNDISVDSILRMYGFPYHVITTTRDGLLSDGSIGTVKFKRLELIGQGRS